MGWRYPPGCATKRLKAEDFPGLSSEDDLLDMAAEAYPLAVDKEGTDLENSILKVLARKRG